MIGITGGSGFIGRHVVSTLLGLGTPARVLTRRKPESTRCEVFIGDVLDRQCLSGFVQGCDSIIHLAGIAHTQARDEADALRTGAINVQGTTNVLEAAKSSAVRRVIVASSSQVYAGQSGLAIKEDAPLDRANPYSQSKIEAEKVCSRFTEGMEVVIVRPCLTYGPGARHNLLKLMTAVDKGYYFHLSGKTPLRSFLSVKNAASAILHLLENGEAGGIYSVADEQPRELADFVNLIASYLDRRPPKTINHSLVKAASALLAPFQMIGIRTPLNREALAKLTTPLTLDVSRLARSGFQWSGNENEVVREMVEDYRRRLHP